MLKAGDEGAQQSFDFCPSGGRGAGLGCTAAEEPALSITYATLLGVQPASPLLGFGLTDRLGLQVNLANGNLLAHASDLAVASTGLPLALDRWYNSQGPVDGPLGNWSMGTAADVQLLNRSGSDVILIGPSLTVVSFHLRPDGSYASPPGLDATLVKNPDGGFTLTSQASGVRDQFAVVPDPGHEIDSLTSVVDRNGNAVRFSYSTDLFGNGDLIGVTDSQGRQVGGFTYGFLQKKPLQSFQDWSGRRYQYAENGSGSDLTDYIDPAGQHTQYGYDASNNLVQITDPTGRVTTLGYDAGQRLTSLTLGAGSAVSGTYQFSYDTSGGPSVTVTTVTDPNGHRTAYTTDIRGRLTKVTDALGNTSQQTWTGDNHLQTSTDALGHVTTYGYDANNNLTSVQLPPTPPLTAGPVARAVYGTVANIPYFFVPTSATDAQGHTTTYGHDGNGNVTTTSMPAMVNSQNQVSAISASAIYNANGTVASATDFNGNTTTYQYDSTGNLTKIIPPTYSGGTQLGPTNIAPDGLSRPQTVTDGNGHTTTSTYDPLDRVTNEQFQDGSVGYGYDADGNQTSMTDSSGTTSYQYDARNRQTQKTLPAGLGGGTFAFGYDPGSNLTSYQDAGGTVGYGYNAADELTTLTEPGGAQTGFGYDQDRRRTTTTYPDGVTMTTGYDPSGRIAGVTARNASTTLVGLTYSYVHNGTDTTLIWQVQENDAPGVGPSPTRNYTTTDLYDPRGLQLTWAVHNNANNTTVHDYEYQFDANGNRTQIVADATVSPPPLNPTTTLAYNAVNELTATTLFSGTGGQVAQATWNWDANANLTGNSGYPGISSPATLTYNQHNQTTSITDVYQHPVAMTYAGPGQGERLSADWSSEPSGKTPEFGHTAYTNGGLGLASKTDSTGTTYYTYDPSGLPVSERTPGGTYYFVFDALGNTVMLVDPPSGSPVAMPSPCPTGNQSGDQWQAPGTNALDELPFQQGGAFQEMSDVGTGNTFAYGAFSGASGTGVTPYQETVAAPKAAPHYK